MCKKTVFLWNIFYYFRQGGYVFITVCQQNYAKTTQLTFTKFGGKMEDCLALVEVCTLLCAILVNNILAYC